MHKFACVYVCVCVFLGVSGHVSLCVYLPLFPLSSHPENRGALRAEVTNRRSLDLFGSHNSYKYIIANIYILNRHISQMPGLLRPSQKFEGSDDVELRSIMATSKSNL